jgi:hypothetical protein
VLWRAGVHGKEAFAKARGVVELVTVGELVIEHVVNELGGEKEQGAVEADVAPGAAAGPARALRSDRHAPDAHALGQGEPAEAWHKHAFCPRREPRPQSLEGIVVSTWAREDDEAIAVLLDTCAAWVRICGVDAKAPLYRSESDLVGDGRARWSKGDPAEAKSRPLDPSCAGRDERRDPRRVKALRYDHDKAITGRQDEACMAGPRTSADRVGGKRR